MDNQHIAALLKKYRHLLEDYLELINDNERFADLILLLRDILTQSSNELSAYFNLNDVDRPIVSYLQAVYTARDTHTQCLERLQRHLHHTQVRTTHFNGIRATLEHTLERVTPLLALTNVPTMELAYIELLGPKLNLLTAESRTALDYLELEVFEIKHITADLQRTFHHLALDLAPDDNLKPSLGPSLAPVLTLAQQVDVSLALIQEMESLICTHIAEHRRRQRLGLDLNNQPIPREHLDKLLALQAQLRAELQRHATQEAQLALQNTRQTTPTLTPKLTPWTGTGGQGSDNDA